MVRAKKEDLDFAFPTSTLSMMNSPNSPFSNSNSGGFMPADFGSRVKTPLYSRTHTPTNASGGGRANNNNNNINKNNVSTTTTAMSPPRSLSPSKQPVSPTPGDPSSSDFMKPIRLTPQSSPSLLASSSSLNMSKLDLQQQEHDHNSDSEDDEHSHSAVGGGILFPALLPVSEADEERKRATSALSQRASVHFPDLTPNAHGTTVGSTRANDTAPWKTGIHGQMAGANFVELGTWAESNTQEDLDGLGTGLGLGLKYGLERSTHSESRRGAREAISEGHRQRRALEAHRINAIDSAVCVCYIYKYIYLHF
jgi:hypothetical protein